MDYIWEKSYKCFSVSKKKLYTLPRKYKAVKVYAYAKHSGKYFVGTSGNWDEIKIYNKKSKMKAAVEYGSFEYYYE